MAEDFEATTNINPDTSGNLEKLLLRLLELTEDCKNELIEIKNKP